MDEQKVKNYSSLGNGASEMASQSAGYHHQVAIRGIVKAVILGCELIQLPLLNYYKPI